jgi:hypothetical protein
MKNVGLERFHSPATANRLPRLFDNQVAYLPS